VGRIEKDDCVEGVREENKTTPLKKLGARQARKLAQQDHDALIEGQRQCCSEA
jgi:hypothetical protein